MSKTNDNEAAVLTPEQMMRGTLKVFPMSEQEKLTQKSLERYARSGINLVQESSMVATLVEVLGHVKGEKPPIHPALVVYLMKAYSGAAAVYHQMQEDLPVFLGSLGIEIKTPLTEPEAMEEALDAIEAYLAASVRKAVEGGLDLNQPLSDEEEEHIKKSLGG